MKCAECGTEMANQTDINRALCHMEFLIEDSTPTCPKCSDSEEIADILANPNTDCNTCRHPKNDYCVERRTLMQKEKGVYQAPDKVEDQPKEKGPSPAGYICNKEGEICDALDSWYNGGSHCYGRCKDGAWENIKQWSQGHGCETPETCDRITH